MYGTIRFSTRHDEAAKPLILDLILCVGGGQKARNVVQNISFLRLKCPVSAT